MAEILVGTAKGLFEVDQAPGETAGVRGAAPDEALAGRSVIALAVDGDELWALLDGAVLAWRDAAGAWTDLAVSSSFEATCLLASSHGVFVGTGEAHLLHLRGGALVHGDGFDEIEGRDAWYTPWGGPAAVRSMAEDGAGRLHANVHVGGIPRSSDGGQTWEPTLDIDDDVHQVIAHPSAADVVLAAAAVGLSVSREGGAHWRIENTGLQSTYARAVAVVGDAVLLTASDGPRGGRSAIYRTAFDSNGSDTPGIEFRKCTEGLPDWFEGNIDTGWLSARGTHAAFGAPDGRVYTSADAGITWRVAAEGLPEIRALVLASGKGAGG